MHRFADKGASEAIAAFVELALGRVFEPGLLFEVEAIKEIHRDCLAVNADAVGGKHIAIEVEHHHQRIHAVSTGVVIHRADEGVARIRVFPVRRVIGGGVKAECLHVAVALEQIAVDNFAQRFRGLRQLVRVIVAQHAFFDGEHIANHQRGQGAHQHQQNHEFIANAEISDAHRHNIFPCAGRFFYYYVWRYSPISCYLIAQGVNCK